MEIGEAMTSSQRWDETKISVDVDDVNCQCIDNSHLTTRRKRLEEGDVKDKKRIRNHRQAGTTASGGIIWRF